MSNTDVIPYEERIGALSIPDLKSQVALIHQVMREVMKEGEDYGKIPGIDKPTIFKAGAEKLCLLFRLDPQYEIEQKQEGQHLTIISKCTLWHIPTGKRFGSGMGSCSTKESRYAYRNAARKCPHCQAEAIIKGKEEYGGGWVCFKKKNGCGAKFKDGDASIESQVVGRIPNEDIADQYNTVLKMANKRSQNAAVLTTTGASALLTQDIEDMPDFIPANAKATGGNPPSTPADIPPAASAPGAPSADGETRSETLRRMCNDAHMAVKDILGKAGVESAEEISEDDWNSAVRMLKKKAASVRATA